MIKGNDYTALNWPGVKFFMPRLATLSACPIETTLILIRDTWKGFDVSEFDCWDNRLWCAEKIHLQLQLVGVDRAVSGHSG